MRPTHNEKHKMKNMMMNHRDHHPHERDERLETGLEEIVDMAETRSPRAACVRLFQRERGKLTWERLVPALHTIWLDRSGLRDLTEQGPPTAECLAQWIEDFVERYPDERDDEDDEEEEDVDEDGNLAGFIVEE